MVKKGGQTLYIYIHIVHLTCTVCHTIPRLWAAIICYIRERKRIVVVYATERPTLVLTRPAALQKRSRVSQR